MEKQATVITKANALQNFMSVLQIRNETDPARNSTDTAGRAKSKPRCSYCYPLTIKGKRSEVRTANERSATTFVQRLHESSSGKNCDGVAEQCASALRLFGLRLVGEMAVHFVDLELIRVREPALRSERKRVSDSAPSFANLFEEKKR